jgi:hypothetical protein
MWLTNTGSSADFEWFAQVPGALGDYVLFAPDVRVDYFGWNTGINIANLVETDNNVTVQYFNMFGNATGTRSQRLAPHGMTYFYDPSQLPQDNSSQDPEEDLNADVVGSGLIWSDYPVAVAVDATKYPESTTELDANVFQGTTYSATANYYTWQSVPLVQKGNPATGMGATSGINMMNPNAVAAQALVYWINQSGFGADNFGTTGLAIPAYANGFVYTLAQHNLPNGFYGAAVVTSTYGIVATSANVDYQVQYDGSVIWNAFNPCGFYRAVGDFDCFLGDPFQQPEGGSVKKIFFDEFDNRVEGAYAALWNEAAYQIYYLGNDYLGIPQILEGTSDHNGEVTWTNVPEGDWYLFTDHQTVWLWNNQGLPMFEQGDFYPDYEFSFTLFTGEDLVFENELFYIRAEKAVYTGIPGVEVCLIGDVDEDGYDEEDIVVECQIANEDGDAYFYDLDEGWYVVVVNAGIEFDFNPVYETYIGDAEFFEWGGRYENFPILDELGVGGLYKEFYVGEYLGEVDWDNIEGAVEIFCETPVPAVDGTCEDGDTYAIINAVDLVPVAEDTYAFELNSIYEGDYTLCWQFDLTITDGLVIPAVNEVQSADITGAIAGPVSITWGAPIVAPAAVFAAWAPGADAANQLGLQAAVDVSLGVGNATVTVVGDVITITFIGAYAGMDIAPFTAIATGPVIPIVAVATTSVIGSPGATEDYTVFWFGCEEFTITEGETFELFNDIDEDGVVVGDIVVSLDTTVAGETYEVCLQYGILFEAVLDCDDAVVGNGASVLVVMSPDILALFNAFLEDQAGFQIPSVFRARAVNQTSDGVTLSLPTEVDVLTDPPPHIFLEAPL